ncbi:hypothetical protein PG985_013327 [Apiospora marii]|uniref:Uncharacterized protein n=1 Tax=Apiospora marii TaxID=335849 RepID=A0ABR1R8X0_9PEZI
MTGLGMAWDLAEMGEQHINSVAAGGSKQGIEPPSANATATVPPADLGRAAGVLLIEALSSAG